VLEPNRVFLLRLTVN